MLEWIEGKDSLFLFEQILTRAMRHVGELWELNEISVADEHIATNVCQLLLSRYATEKIEQRQEFVPELWTKPKAMLFCIEGIIDEVVQGIYEEYAELLETYGEYGKEKCREDNHHHFKLVNNLLTSRGMKTDHIIDNFLKIKKAMRDKELDGKEAFYQRCLS